MRFSLAPYVYKNGNPGSPTGQVNFYKSVNIFSYEDVCYMILLLYNLVMQQLTLQN